VTRVVNIRQEEADIYIGRAAGPRGYFGSPFVIGHDGTRQEVLAAFRAWFGARLRLDPEYKMRVESLRGKTLGCFCKPEPCHGDVIADYLDNQTSAT
jgi:hypothetical protein